MTVKILSVLLIGSVIIASVWAHPMKKTEAKAKSAETVKSKVPAKLHEQEKELEDLAKLQKEKVNHAVLQSSSDIKIVENNGKSEKTLKTTDNVIDGNNGKVVSSVKKVRKIGVAKGNKPKVEAKTEVDIPAEGIHNTFQDNLFEDDRQEEKKAAFKKSLPENAAFEESLVNSPENDIKDLIKSSESIAKYLLETGRFDKLDQSLRDVVRIGLMSKTEASEYKKMVLEYYEKLVELREAEELQSKLNAPPLDYAEQDYVMPFNGAGDTLDNRIYPYGQVESASEDNSRYEDSNEEDSYPIDPSVNAQSEYVDIPADAIQQSYSRFPDMKQELVPVSREEEPQENSDWLTGLLEQANYGGYPEAESILNTISDSQPTSRAEREKIQRIIESVLARNALKSSEESSEMENEDETNEEEEEAEEEAEAAAAAAEAEANRENSLRERMRLRSRMNGRIPRRKVEPIALSKKTPAQSSERRDKKAETKKQDPESKRKSA